MDNAEFETRLDRVSRAADVVNSLPKKLQAGAFQYLIGGDVPIVEVPPARHQAEGNSSSSTLTPAPASTDAGSKPTPRARKNGSKPGKSASNDLSIDLFPEGKTSFKDFAAEKAPSTNNERYAVAVYWILRVAELEAATVAQVMSCFMVADWRLPNDSGNGASKSRVAGYLSSGSSEDLKLSSIGLNLVKSDLPHAKTKS
ncbi:hypothetical protein [Microbacterium sp. WCS2018Hpa-23]|uniref:hypothetical protein n=1 Tax=Microbacterium sp. WCS2018Hpa-23 TaxID=3073634 RepID=UPI0028835768|nr:hypothetical protein [Microbacterium sp. WCS2018Hpa-23]